MSRPASLFPLFADVTTIKGVAAKTSDALKKLLSGTRLLGTQPQNVPIRDLIFHAPVSVTDRSHITSIAEAKPDSIVTLKVTTEKHHSVSGGNRFSRRPHRITVADESGSMMLVYFSAKGDYLTKVYPVDGTKVISGRVELHDGVLQMVHPDRIGNVNELESIAVIEPNYPLSAGISQKQLTGWIAQALQRVPDLEEWIAADIVAKKQWPAWKAAITQLHNPTSQAETQPEAKHRQRLSYDELLAHQLALALMRERNEALPATAIPMHSELQQRVRDALPYSLTNGQAEVLADIETEMHSGMRMMRMLQGDVGSGKTVVALMAMLNAVDAGGQAAMMVPTDLLARQHAASLRNMLRGTNVQVAYLSGKLPKKEKEAMQAAIAAGTFDIVVGTHALFQESVQFRKLAMVVVDEQHRFGVNQRIALSNKGDNPHLLLMTATPIPRTLTMTAYGDMACSLLKEKPQGRLPIDTRAVPLARIDEVVAGLRRVMENGNKVYWVCPLVEEKEPDMLGHSFAGDLAAAEERHRVLKQIYGDRVGLVHGQMKPSVRESEMQKFADGDYDVLVATTVIEVGVDVPEATAIVIEHAERFGLAQLHQLRGRVGRNDQQSNCILLYNPLCSEVAQRRLSIMRETNDGFIIAEEDLMLRGAGEVLGTRQSGLPAFYFADMIQHRELVQMAHQDVKHVLHQDPTLTSERGQALRVLLSLFDYDVEQMQHVAA